MQNRWSQVVALVMVLGLVNTLPAASPAPTTITIPDMHCNGCAKKVATKLYQVAGVSAVQADAQAKIIKVTPKSRVVLSPRDLWEAVEKAGKHPSRLDGPSGRYTAKPQS